MIDGSITEKLCMLNLNQMPRHIIMWKMIHIIMWKMVRNKRMPVSRRRMGMKMIESLTCLRTCTSLSHRVLERTQYFPSWLGR
jgi:hypothetical protein